MGSVNIAGRNVRARADIIWDGVVMDIKTGTPPTKKQLMDGTMPQLPLEAFIMQNNGFPLKMRDISITPIIQFLQLTDIINLLILQFLKKFERGKTPKTKPND